MQSAFTWPFLIHTETLWGTGISSVSKLHPLVRAIKVKSICRTGSPQQLPYLTSPPPLHPPSPRLTSNPPWLLGILELSALAHAQPLLLLAPRRTPWPISPGTAAPDARCWMPASRGPLMELETVVQSHLRGGLCHLVPWLGSTPTPLH